MSKLYIGNQLVVNPDTKLEKVELTQAEYDALTTKEDNVLYLITDAVNPLEELSDTIDQHLQNVSNGLNHIPSGGAENQILVYQSEGKAKWSNLTDLSLPIEDLVSYGVSWKPGVADPILTRVGNMAYHKTLPIQSQMRGCIYDSINKEVVYWLDEDNWAYYKGGNPNKGEEESLANLHGGRGEVMVYVPPFYIKSWDEPDRREVRISAVKIDDSWEYQPPLFVGAYRSTVLSEALEGSGAGYLGALPANSAISVVNTESYCRGGNGDSTNDATEDIFKRNLGKPRTDIDRATFREYARNAGKELMSYRQYKNIMYWLYVIEYANFNCQAPFNSELTSEGYHQGGLGNGITNIPDWGTWTAYNGNNPICPCGYTNDIGNGTGIKLIAPNGPTPVGSVYAIRWRGIENPFGDIWTNLDGIIIDADATNHDPVGYNLVYTTNNPANYNDSDVANMILSGLEIHADGYTKEFDLGSTAEIIPRSIGGDVTEYKCDYHWTGSRNTDLRTLLVGGDADSGGLAGFGLFDYAGGVAFAHSYVGFRTVSAL